MTAAQTWVGKMPANHVRWPALQLRGVTRNLGARRVLGVIDLELHQGAVCLIEGPNGAGKTTLLRVSAGLLTPSSGTVEARHPAIYLAAGAGARPEQTVDRAIAWVARVAPDVGMPAGSAQELVGLDRCDARVGALSSGQRVRLSLALALVARAALVCLDEPTAHLDSAGVEHAIAAIRALARAGTAVLVAAPEPGALLEVADGRVHLDSGVAGVAS